MSIPRSGMIKCIIPTIIDSSRLFFLDKFIVPTPSDNEKVSILRATEIVSIVTNSTIKKSSYHSLWRRVCFIPNIFEAFLLQKIDILLHQYYFLLLLINIKEETLHTTNFFLSLYLV